MRREGNLMTCTVRELAIHLASSINLADVLGNAFTDCDFCIIDGENVNCTFNYVKSRAEQWYGIKAVDTGFDSTELVLIADYYGGSCPSMAEIWSGMYTYEGVADLIEKTLLNTLNVQEAANPDTMLLTEFLVEVKPTKYVVRLSALKYGEVHVIAESEEEARHKAAELFNGDGVIWHSGELTDMTVEEEI